LLEPPALEVCDATVILPAVPLFKFPFAFALALLPVLLTLETTCEEPPPFCNEASCASSALIRAFSLSMAELALELDDDEPPPPSPPAPRSFRDGEEVDVVLDVPLDPEVLDGHESPVVRAVALLSRFDAPELPLLVASQRAVAAAAVADVGNWICMDTLPTLSDATKVSGYRS